MLAPLSNYWGRAGPPAPPPPPSSYAFGLIRICVVANIPTIFASGALKAKLYHPFQDNIEKLE